jgi:bifunctional non-homologous end joining protein LigD
MELTWIEPCIPTLVKTPPIGSDWLHEIKHDGYRTISVIVRGRAQIFTRRGHDWSARMPNIKAALERLKVKSAVIDGEVVMTDKDGVSDFFALHLALARKSAPDATLMAFDVLELDGEDLRPAPLEERRAILEKLLRKPGPWLQFSAAAEGRGSRSGVPPVTSASRASSRNGGARLIDQARMRAGARRSAPRSSISR